MREENQQRRLPENSDCGNGCNGRIALASGIF